MNKAFLAYGIVITAFFCGCSGQDMPQHPQSSDYFDIKKYFEQEAARLEKQNTRINKTVVVDGSGETKSVAIADWKKELGVFMDAEITRASWRGQFKIEKTADGASYTSSEDKIPVKKLSVISRNGKVTGIIILIKNNNILYRSVDSLVYYPDSVYQVIKHQNIRFLSDKTYTVKGNF